MVGWKIPQLVRWSSHQNLHRLAHGAMFGFPSVNQPQQTWMIKSQKLAKSKSHQDHEISVNIHQIPIYILRRDFPILMFPKILPILYRISMNFPHVFPHKFDDSSREFAHQKLWMGQRNPAPPIWDGCLKPIQNPWDITRYTAHRRPWGIQHTSNAEHLFSCWFTVVRAFQSILDLSRSRAIG